MRTAAAVPTGGDDARLIQTLTEPEGTSLLAQAAELAGFQRLAVLAYLRRPFGRRDRDLPLPPDLEWLHYRRLRHGKFARTIAATYEDSLDCPGLAGLRTVDETIATHKHTGLFCPRAWHLALQGGRPVGVCLVNNLRGAGELVYLASCPRPADRASAGRSGAGDSATPPPWACRRSAWRSISANAPALRLYESGVSAKIRRRLAYFMPAAGLESLQL